MVGPLPQVGQAFPCCPLFAGLTRTWHNHSTVVRCTEEAGIYMQLRLPREAREAKGVVYTKPWVVDLILDLVGYRAEADLATLVAVEPAAGEGAFLVRMVRRLLASLQLHGRSLGDAKRALLAYELDGKASAWARELVVD